MSLYVFDLDGVIYRMDEPIPDAAQALAALKARGHSVAFLTNNSSRTRQEYSQKLTNMGIPCTAPSVMTSAYALALWFQQQTTPGAQAYIIGESGLAAELEQAGVKLLQSAEGAEFVVCGWDRQFTYAKLATAHRAITAGARFIATNRDPTYPAAGGYTLPGSGALVASIETCTGIQPLVIGKPEPYSLQLLLQQDGVDPGDCVMVGDRLDTDIACGIAAGARTALVLTGVHTRTDLEHYPQFVPDVVLSSLLELL